MKPITVKEMIITHIKEGDYNGLCNEEESCRCGWDDSIPCSDIGILNYIFAYKHFDGIYRKVKDVKIL